MVRKTKTAKGKGAKTLDPRTVRKVIGLRKRGTPWPEILEQLGEGPAFIHRVRPLMKEIDPSSVLPLGPGSPNYGKAKSK